VARIKENYLLRMLRLL